MPVNSYYGGHGSEVMTNMQSEYGSPAKAKQVFYATLNKRKHPKPMAYGGLVDPYDDPNDPRYRDLQQQGPPPPPDPQLSAMDPEQGPPSPMPAEQGPPQPQTAQELEGPPQLFTPPKVGIGPEATPEPEVPRTPFQGAMPPPRVIPPLATPPPAPAPRRTMPFQGAMPPTPAKIPQSAPPPPPQPVTDAYQQQEKAFQNRKEPGKGRQILAGALAATRLRGAAPYVSGEAARGRELEKLGAARQAATEEQQNINHTQDRALKAKLAEAADADRDAAREQLALSRKPQQTIPGRIQEAEGALDAEGNPRYSPEDLRYIGANGKLPDPKSKTMTGPALQVDLLTKQHLAAAAEKGEVITEEEAHNRALEDFAKKYKTGVETSQPAEYKKDAESTSGYSRIYRSNKTGQIVNVVRDIEVPNSYAGSVSTQQTVRFVPQADGTIREVPVTSTTTRQRPGATPPQSRASSPIPPSAPAPSSPPGPPAPQGRIVGATPAGAKRVVEAQELSPAGQAQMKEVDVVSRQFDDLLKKLDAYKTDNNPLTLSTAMAKYKMGIKSPEGDLGNEISNLSLASIQGMMPFASKSRNYQFIRDIGQHLPNLAVVGGDSPAMIYDKLLKARLNFAKMEAAVKRFETKHATTNPGPVPLPKETARLYYRATNGDPAKARQMAVADGWQP